MRFLFVCVCAASIVAAIGRCRPAKLPQVAMQQSGSPSPVSLCSISSRFRVYKLPVQYTAPHPPLHPIQVSPSVRQSVRQSVNCQAKSIAQLRFDLVLRTVRSFGKSSRILECIHVQFHSASGIIVCCRFRWLIMVRSFWYSKHSGREQNG